MRLLIQSQRTGRFLVPNERSGVPEWVSSLREAGGGVVFDVEAAYQLAEDHCDLEDQPVFVDLDRLGTASDYASAAAVDAARSAASAVVANASSVPDGNHGDNTDRGT